MKPEPRPLAGDVVTWGDRVTAHRVIEVREDGVLVNTVYGIFHIWYATDHIEVLNQEPGYVQ